MKKKISGWVMAVAAVAAFTLLGLGSFERDETPEISGTVPPVKERAVQAPVLDIETPDVVCTSTNQGALDASSGLVVLEERQVMQANGTIRRDQLVKRAGRYPNRLVSEILQKDVRQKKFVPVSRVEMAADHVLVKLNADVSIEVLENLVSQFNAEIIRPLGGNAFMVQLEAPGLDAVEEAIGFFMEASQDIAYAEPDYVRYPTATPNDTEFGQLWGLTKIQAPTAWDTTTGSKDVVVAVIDTGTDLDHPDLVSNLWVNTGEVPEDGIDNDNNGYIDDVNGWNFVAGNGNPEDDHSHGTHCAGTIGAVGNNANQVVGVCWDVSLMTLKSADASGFFSSDTSLAVRYAVNNGAKVLSNSYGGEGESQTEYDAILYAHNNGAIFVAAAGNGGVDGIGDDNDIVPQYPASYDVPNVISVAATASNDVLAAFSNFGSSSVDLAAPGVDILSTTPNGETGQMSGTSMACPHVAGAMALLVAVNPAVTPSEAKQLLLDTVDPLVGLSGKVVSGGRLNLPLLLADASDSDGDGMPDSWEERYGFNPLDPSDGGTNDFDGDFLTNLGEYQNSCVPTNSDTDADSLIDGWEVRYGFNPLNVAGSLPRIQYFGNSTECKNAYDVVVESNYAYVADGFDGFKVLDVTNPNNPQKVAGLAIAGLTHGIEVEGNYAYVSDTTTGFHIIDISTATNPAVVGLVGTNAYNSAIQGNYAYVAGGTNGFFVVNISDPANPSIVGSYDNSVAGYDFKNVVVNGNYAYCTVDDSFVRLYIANPANPVWSASQGIAPGMSGALYFNGTHFFVGGSSDGVVVYNAAMSYVSRYEPAAGATGLHEANGFLYVGLGNGGVRVLDASNPANLTGYAKYTRTQVQGLFYSDGYVYAAGLGSGLHVFVSGDDSDGDGLYDKWERDNFGDLDETAQGDTDNDGIINWGEYLAGLVPTDDDQDSDTLIDGFDEVQTYLTDPRTPDTDGDGLTDDFEITTNGVDNLYLTSPIEADTDGDGMTDKWEIDNGLDPLKGDSGLDPDDDGASNLEEEQAGTDPQNPDTDGDDMPDGWEIDNNLDPLFDDASGDPDGDNTVSGLDLTNLGEYNWVTNGFTNSYPVILQQPTDPHKSDTDDDLLGDNWEMIADGRTATNFNGGSITNIYITDPNKWDTDGDGLPDGWEENFYISPVSTNGANGADGDMDGDGLTNYEEYLNGSDPFSNDTDGDGFPDDWERDWGTQATNAADPVVVDDNGPYDWWMHGGQPQDPQLSDPDEDGSKAHPFDAIQEAINVASNGYTILVKEGQYYGTGNRNINPGLLQLRILAENQTNVAATVVRSHGLSPVFVYEGGQITNSVLAGLTIQSSMQGIDCSNGDCGEMHGIECKAASSPLITNCVVEICRDDAIYCEFGSSPIISNVTIRAIYEGHGIYAKSGSTPMVMDCVIDDIGVGCGIYAVDSDGLVVSNTVISNCENGVGPGRGIWLVNDADAAIYNSTISGCQGGIRCDNSSPTIDRCTIVNNGAPDYYMVDGFGYMSNTNIAEVAADSDSGITDEQHVEENGGGILLMSGSFPSIQNCVIYSNRTWASDPDYPENVSKPYYGLGGGIYAGENCATRLVNCTVADNIAMTLGGGFTTFGNFVEHMRNDILWDNYCHNAWLDKDVDPPVLRQPGNVFFNSLHCNEGTSHFDPWYCNISDGFGFVVDRFNMNANPMFVGGGDYHITTNSPCVDTGTYYEAPLYDRDGLPRPLDGDTITNNYFTVDIGAYEYLNPNADTDGDGFSDWVEVYTNKTDPTDKESFMFAALDAFMQVFGLFDINMDSDSDGLSNYQEYQAQTDPTTDDTDGDNSSDGDEAVAGTNPLDETSYFYVSDIQPLAGGGCQVTFDSVVGRVYTIYCCTELGGAWIEVAGGIAGTGAPISVQDPVNEGSCFYKAEVDLQ